MPDNKTKLFFRNSASFYCIYQQANIAFCFQTGYNNLIRHKNDRPAAFAGRSKKVSFSMNETVTKRFLLYFRLMMVAWILIANAFFHAIEFEYSWLVFLSNIMLFTMEGDIKDRFISVELGGLVGMVLTVLAMLAIGALTPVLGGMLGLLLPLGVVLSSCTPTPPRC